MINLVLDGVVMDVANACEPLAQVPQTGCNHGDNHHKTRPAVPQPERGVSPRSGFKAEITCYIKSSACISASIYLPIGSRTWLSNEKEFFHDFAASLPDGELTSDSYKRMKSFTFTVTVRMNITSTAQEYSFHLTVFYKYIYVF